MEITDDYLIGRVIMTGDCLCFWCWRNVEGRAIAFRLPVNVVFHPECAEKAAVHLSTLARTIKPIVDDKPISTNNPHMGRNKPSNYGR